MSQSKWIEDSIFAHGLQIVAGVDEAGRGACAGPLVATAVALDKSSATELAASVSQLAKKAKSLDSKSWSEQERHLLSAKIRKIALAVEVIIVDPMEIDHFGLQVMNESAMRRAISQISVKLDYAITDGYSIEGLAVPSLAVWKGDAVSLSVGAASIIAKVTRDQIMVDLDHQFPGYGLAGHKGYSSKSHMDAIAQFGVLPIHRRSYANVAAFLKG